MSLSSQSREALISVRLVVADHYMAAPVPGLDPLVSPFTGAAIKRLPVIRVFGSTVSGQRACLHLHGIFPYIYVPMPENEKVAFKELNCQAQVPSPVLLDPKPNPNQIKIQVQLGLG